MLLGLICFSHSGQSAVPVLDAMTPLVEAERDVKWEAHLVWQVLPFKKEGAVAGEGSCDGLISAALIGAMRWLSPGLVRTPSCQGPFSSSSPSCPPSLRDLI